jgi:IMP cyclohydrolase
MTDDLICLESMIYSGRGITLGMTIEGLPFVGYTLTGRSESSQARRLTYDKSNESISTEVTDLEQLNKGNPALLIYPAIQKAGNRIVASNGLQTKLFAEKSRKSMPFVGPAEILSGPLMKPVVVECIDITSYEPDKPNYTPRINGCIDHLGRAGFSIVKKTDEGKMFCYYPIKLSPGQAFVITTYKGGNENPLVSFEGKPMEAHFSSLTSSGIAMRLYEAIRANSHGDFKAAAACMILNKDDSVSQTIVNRHFKRFDKEE